APHLGDFIADGRQVLFREQALAPASLKSRRVQQGRELTTPSRSRGNLLQAVVEEAGKGNIQDRSVDLALILQYVGEVDVRISEHKLVRHRRIKYMRRSEERRVGEE